jgi:hypothetical protein
VLEANTEKALSSPLWLDVSLKTVMQFVQLKEVNVLEEQLLASLLEWGKHKVAELGGDPQDGATRALIFPALKFIRFSKMNLDNFALCPSLRV